MKAPQFIEPVDNPSLMSDKTEKEIAQTNQVRAVQINVQNGLKQYRPSNQ
jgi:hypothetical protein